MKKPPRSAMVGLLLCLCLCLSCASWAQTARARSSADVDLNARLKETESDLRVLETAVRMGAKVASFCGNCHGPDGNSTTSDTPNLAGQNTAYLLEQLRQFADGRRKNLFMEGMIKALTADEKIGVVLYYTSKEVTRKSAANLALASKGQVYFNKMCSRCHGGQGRGDEKIARIAGQQPGYLTLTLMRYRDGSVLRNNPVMAANTKTMTDADIAAVVAYVSSM